MECKNRITNCVYFAAGECKSRAETCVNNPTEEPCCDSPSEDKCEQCQETGKADPKNQW